MDVVRMGGGRGDLFKAPKTEGGLPARLFRNNFSPQKYEEQARMPAPHSPSPFIIPFRVVPFLH